MSYVRVTNNNEFVMGDRYNNEIYSFFPGEPVVLHPAAAWHFFQWPGPEEEMKNYTSRRFGWERSGHVGADRNTRVRHELLEDPKRLVDLYWENLTFEEMS